MLRNMRIRKATEDDVSIIYLFEKLGIQHPWTEEMIRKDIVENSRSTYLLAEIPDCSGEMITGGFIGISQILDEIEINNIVVAPAFRRTGMGTALLEAVKDIGTCSGEGTFYLEVRSQNTGARRFYLENGYVEVGVRKDYYSDPLDDAVLMKMEEKR